MWTKTKIDSVKKVNDPRMADQFTGYEEANYILFGYPDDEGIQHNGGRLGAKAGPDGIRSILYKAVQVDKKIHDIGNLNTEAFDSIDLRHKEIQKQLSKCLGQNKKMISFGGGHDYGYPDTASFVDHYINQNPIVINFDAHLDVRKPEKEINSGTPFYRLLENHTGFEFIEIGLQEICNSAFHQKWLEEKGGHSIYLEELLYEGKSLLQKYTEKFGETLIKKRPAFISVDIDCFSSAYAPGCSQSWPLGLEPREFFPLFGLFLNRWDVRGLGIYEVAPNLDENLKTQRLAAQIAYSFLQA